MELLLEVLVMPYSFPISYFAVFFFMIFLKNYLLYFRDLAARSPDFCPQNQYHTSFAGFLSFLLTV